MKINSRLWISFSAMIAVALTSISMAFAQSGGTTAIITDEDRATVLVADKATAEKLSKATCEEKVIFYRDAATKAEEHGKNCDLALKSCEGKGAECQVKLDECTAALGIANGNVKETEALLESEHVKCYKVACTAAEIKAQDPKCYPDGKAGTKAPSASSEGGKKPGGKSLVGPAAPAPVSYCLDSTGVLSMVGGPLALERDDFIAVRFVSKTNNFIRIECVPTWKAYDKLLKKACLENDVKAGCDKAKAVREWKEGFDALGTPLTSYTWINAVNTAETLRVNVADILVRLKALEGRVGALEDKVNNDHEPRITALEKAVNKTFSLSFSGEVGGIFSPVSTTLALTVRTDLIIRTSMQFGHAGYVGGSVGRGWTADVDGIPQPNTVVYTFHGGYHGILNPTDVDPSVYAVRLGGVLLGAVPIEANQDMSAGGPEVGFNYNYKRLNLGVELAVLFGRFQQHARDASQGGRVVRAMYGNQVALKPGIYLGFIF